MHNCDECNDPIGMNRWTVVGPHFDARFCSVNCLFQFIRKTFGNQITSFLFKREAEKQKKIDLPNQGEGV